MRQAAITPLAAVLAAPILWLGSTAMAQNDYVEVTETTVAEQPEAVRGEVVAPQVTDEPEAEPARAALPVTGSDASLFVLGGGAALALAAIARRMARRPAGGS